MRRQPRQLRVNETLTLLFDDDDAFESHHLAFHVDDAEFNAILARIKRSGDAPVRGRS
jgi:hypothetical protein